MMIKVRFKGNEYYLTNGDTNNGPIATAEEFCNGKVSFAYLLNGKIIKHNEQLGTVEDLEIIGEVENLQPTAQARIEMLEWLFGGFES